MISQNAIVLEETVVGIVMRQNASAIQNPTRKEATMESNNAKLREALELARFYMSRAPEAESRPYVKNGQCEMLFLVDVLRTVDATLAAPARNCDIYATVEEARKVWCGAPSRDWDYLCDWLYATTKETEAHQ